jgi:molybdopterin-dependent oxidoreductase-like protein protein/molybdenum-dependent oxidoreductase-like protein
VLAGADGPVVEKTPAFVKSLPMWKAVEETTLIAYEMNGEPLPHWNGFPARVIVPGWTATYWMKHLTSIKAVTNPFDGFWMKSAYRIPVAKFPLVARFSSQETAVNTPITEMMVNSLITSHADGDTVTGGRKITIGGIAWDAGYGISDVEVSSDKGATWAAANLGVSHGRYALRTFSRKIIVPWKRTLTIMVRASNAIGQTQATTLIANPAGYHHNVIQTLTLTAA